MITFYIANAIITLLVGVLIFVFSIVDSVIFALNIIFLLITLEIPTFYLLFVGRKKLSSNNNELLAMSILITLFMFITNLVFYSICIYIHSTNCKLFLLYTAIFHSVIAVVLLIVKGATDYITKQY